MWLDHDVVIVDDEVDTGGSMVQAVNIAKENGARDVYVAFIHPGLTANAAERLSATDVKEFITTDTIPIPEQQTSFIWRSIEDPIQLHHSSVK